MNSKPTEPGTATSPVITMQLEIVERTDEKPSGQKNSVRFSFATKHRQRG